MGHAENYLEETKRILDLIDKSAVEKLAQAIRSLREKGGRLFFLGVGGGAAHASHAVNDFRKIVNIEAYTPADNVAELTARINDDGWENVFADWLKASRLIDRDAVMVFSVGGGNLDKNVSPNLVKALQYAEKKGAKIFGIVGRDGGYTAKMADVCLIIPTVNPSHVTCHTEGLQAVLWHLLISHPDLKKYEGKWESLK